MTKIILIAVLALVATTAADPYVFSQFYAPAYPAYAASGLSAALTAPGYPATAYNAAALTAPVYSAALTAPAVPATYPVSSMSAYSYGSGYSLQEGVPAVNLVSAPPSYLPAAYVADYFYRR